MSGSSKDGIDASLLKFSNHNDDFNWEVVNHFLIDAPNDVMKLLDINESDSLAKVLYHDFEFARFLSQEILKIKEKYEIDYVAIHGHTVLHLPEKGSTFQMGSAATISSLTGLNAIDNFRLQDIALSGTGTPLAPLADTYLFPGFDAYINLGGIANISVVQKSKVIGFDVCPCNQVLNYFAQKIGLPFDTNGIHAKGGIAHNTVLKEWSEISFFSKKPPKSLDNNWIQKKHIPFIETFNLSPKDTLATYTKLIVRLLHETLIKYEIKNVFLSGGGIQNLYIQELFSEIANRDELTVTIPNLDVINYKESMLMALVGYFRITEQVNIFNSVTGASASSIAGALYLTHE